MRSFKRATIENILANRSVRLEMFSDSLIKDCEFHLLQNATISYAYRFRFIDNIEMNNYPLNLYYMLDSVIDGFVNRSRLLAVRSSLSLAAACHSRLLSVRSCLGGS